MIVQNILLASESYTHPNWDHRNLNDTFSRLYYVIDDEAYYEENGKQIRFKKNLYLTPVKKDISFYENPNDKMLHTYAHVVTMPTIQSFAEIEVIDGTPLADGVALWRKYIYSDDTEHLIRTAQFVISCVEGRLYQKDSVPVQIRNYIDKTEGYSFSMKRLSHDMGYCREYITRQFQIVYRMTPMQYFNQRKMNAALEMLSRGMRIQDVAEELNYASPYSFSKAFKNYFGQSPEKYLNTYYKNIRH